MSTDADKPQPYELNLSVEVYAKLLELATTARDRGDGEQYLAALKEFHRRLRVYPQFGDPLVDLVHQTGHIRIGIIPPLSMRYGVLEEQRVVFRPGPSKHWPGPARVSYNVSPAPGPTSPEGHTDADDEHPP